MSREERAASYLKHLVDVHMGQWTMESTNDGPWTATYIGPAGPMSSYTAATKRDAIVCLALALHFYLQPCTDCSTVLGLSGEDWMAG